MILLSVFSSRIKWNWRSSGWWQVNGRHFGNICFGFFRWCETWTLLGKFHAFILCACWLNWMIFSRWFQLFCWQANERKSQHPFHSINGAANLISIKSNDMKKELCWENSILWFYLLVEWIEFYFRGDFSCFVGRPLRGKVSIHFIWSTPLRT